MRRFIGIGTVIMVGALLLGCGGSDANPEEEVAEVIENYNVAVAEQDGETACALLSPRGQYVAADDHGYGGTLNIDATQQKATCEDGIENRYSGEKKILEQLKFAEVKSVEVRGDEAKAELSVEGFREVVELTNSDGEWTLNKPLPPIDQSF